ncbi:hypothetical protein PMI12_04004 [Variovorax sp. CF313]|nr:hypothetical protein PMI12_04004 [Variovorax sp. CF313]
MKKGRSEIGGEEMSQADGHVQDFLESGAIEGTPMFRAFVGGHGFSAKTAAEKVIREDDVVRGRVQATTYHQLTRTANKRLFRLKERIPARDEDVSGVDLSTKVMQIASQVSLDLANPQS